MRMDIMKERKPMIIVFAGPNGSGKSSVTSLAEISGEYINADEIKKALHCSDMDAAGKATDIRYNLLEKNKDFTFETVLSTERNLELLTKAKQKGYFIRRPPAGGTPCRCTIWATIWGPSASALSLAAPCGTACGRGCWG